MPDIAEVVPTFEIATNSFGFVALAGRRDAAVKRMSTFQNSCARVRVC